MRLCFVVALLLGTGVLAAPPSTSNARSVTLGIGAIRWEGENTDAAFEAFRYFRNNAAKQSGVATKVMLADFATDADWYVDGELRGSVQSVMKARAWTYSMVLTSVSGGVAGASLIAFLATRLPVFLVIGLVTLPVVAIGGIAMVVTKQFANELEGSITGEFTLRRQGKKVATFSVSPVKPRESFADEPPDPGRSREALLAPVFAQLKVDLEGEMKRHPSQPGNAQ